MKATSAVYISPYPNTSLGLCLHDTQPMRSLDHVSARSNVVHESLHVL